MEAPAAAWNSRHAAAPAAAWNSRHEKFQRALRKASNNYANVQLRTFTRWWNNWLEPRGFPVTELCGQIQSGELPFRLLEALEILPAAPVSRGKYTVLGERVVARPRLRLHKINNLQNFLRVIETTDHLKIKLVNIGAEDLADGHRDLVLGLTWALIKHYEIGHVASLSFEQLTDAASLLAWVREQIKDFPEVPPPGGRTLMKSASGKNIHSGASAAAWTKGFCDGRVLAAVVHKHRPDLIERSAFAPDNSGNTKGGGAVPSELARAGSCVRRMGERVRNHHAEDLLTRVFTVCAQHLGVPALLDPADLSGGMVDQLSIVTYVATLRNALLDGTSTTGRRRSVAKAAMESAASERAAAEQAEEEQRAAEAAVRLEHKVVEMAKAEALAAEKGAEEAEVEAVMKEMEVMEMEEKGRTPPAPATDANKLAWKKAAAVKRAGVASSALNAAAAKAQSQAAAAMRAAEEAQARKRNSLSAAAAAAMAAEEMAAAVAAELEEAKQEVPAAVQGNRAKSLWAQASVAVNAQARLSGLLRAARDAKEVVKEAEVAAGVEVAAVAPTLKPSPPSAAAPSPDTAPLEQGPLDTLLRALEERRLQEIGKRPPPSTPTNAPVAASMGGQLASTIAMWDEEERLERERRMRKSRGSASDHYKKAYFKTSPRVSEDEDSYMKAWRRFVDSPARQVKWESELRSDREETGSPPPWASPPTIHVRHRSAPRPSSATNTLENPPWKCGDSWTTSHRQAATWTPLGPTAAHWASKPPSHWRKR